jgi:hypothetical protein
MMISVVTTALIATLAMVGGSAAASADAYGWSYRPVYVFAPSPAHPELQRQDAINAAARAALRERDIVVVRVIGDRVAAELGPPPGADAAELRARFGARRDDFTFILVGKDGGVKLRSDTPVSAGRLSGVIDAMPMRRREMREQNGA